jgi:hypothetical protein
MIHVDHTQLVLDRSRSRVDRLSFFSDISLAASL